MADEMEMVRRMADGNPRYMATEEDTQALARVVMDLKARVEALEAERTPQPHPFTWDEYQQRREPEARP